MAEKAARSARVADLSWIILSFGVWCQVSVDLLLADMVVGDTLQTFRVLWVDLDYFILEKILLTSRLSLPELRSICCRRNF
jgi:hypothetical protein